MKIRFAVAPGQRADLPSLGPFLDSLEQLHFDTVWLSDIPLGALVDPLVGLAYAAARTTRLKLGANLVILGRNPLVLAKSLAQLDRLSEGRLLLSLVLGVDQPGERESLGIGRAHRGRLLEEVVPLLRRWWAGETVDHRSERFNFPGIASPGRPYQDPLELWMGGQGPEALDRTGRLADGWLGAAVTPAEAGDARRRIEEAAARAGRAIDPDHFGISLPYARDRLDDATAAQLRARRPDADPADLVPVGSKGLNEVIHAYVDRGISKFVLRPVGQAFADELPWLADAVLGLQT